MALTPSERSVILCSLQASAELERKTAAHDTGYINKLVKMHTPYRVAALAALGVLHAKKWGVLIRPH